MEEAPSQVIPQLVAFINKQLDHIEPRDMCEVDRKVGTMEQYPSERSNVLPDATLKLLQELRRSLLHLHKSLLDMERADFERNFGRLTSGELLQLVINHAQFAWLRQISALVVQIDEMLDAEEPAMLDDAQNVLAQVRSLFASSADEEFKEKYQAALQRQAAVVMAHSEVTKLLRRSAGVNSDIAELEG